MDNPPISFERYKPDWVMVYVWQYPAMLMSWSWVLFLMGFVGYIMTPVLPDATKKHELQVRYTPTSLPMILVS